MAHDAALLKYEKMETKAHLAFIYNTNGFDLRREPYEWANHKHMQLLWLGKSGKKYEVSATLLNRALEKPDKSLTLR